MENQDPRKINPPPGHENHGVHVCHKCGWPFPKPHPSAKHRRAHKRICGTVEGYKLIDSEENPHLTLSDDEHLSDEDHKTPSPKIAKSSNIGGGKGGAGERSLRSEDDVFSDAAAEFSDAGLSPGIEQHLVDAQESFSYVEKIAENDSSTITEIVEPQNIYTASSQMKNNEVAESSSNQLGSTTLPEVRVLSSTISSKESFISDSGTKGSADVMEYTSSSLGMESDTKGNEINNLEEHLLDTAVTPSENAGETSEAGSKLEEMNGTSDPMTADGTLLPQENPKTNAGEDVLECTPSSIGMESDPKGDEINDVEEHLLDTAVPPSENARETSEVLEEMNGNMSDPMIADGTILSKEEQSDGLGLKMSQSELSPEFESVVCLETFVDTAQVQVETAQGLDFASSDDIIEGCNTKGEGKENVHVLSVPDDIPVVDHPEIMVEGFKDHNALKLNLPVTLDSGEEVRDKKDFRDLVSEENCSSLQSRQLIEGNSGYFSDMRALEDEVNQEVGSRELMVKEVPVEQEAYEIKGTISENLLSDELGANAHAAGIEIEKSQTVCSPEEMEPQDFCNDMSKSILPENATVILSNVDHMVSPMDAEVDQTTNIVVRDDASGHEKARTEKCDIAGYDCKEEATVENHTENLKTTPESANSLCESKTNQMTSLLVTDYVGGNERVKIKICDKAGNGSTEGSTEESLHTKTAPESAGSLSEFQLAEDGMDQSVSNLTDTESAHLDGVSDSSRNGIDVSHLGETDTNIKNFQAEDSQEGVELEISSSDKVQVECVGAVGTDAESNHGGDFELSQKTLEDQMMNEQLLSPIDTKSSVQGSVSVEDKHARVSDRGASGIGSESLQEEGDNKFSKPELGVSAVDVLADSNSQTDSLEGNWGSVSETLPSTDSQASFKAEKDVLKKPKDASEGHSDKSEIFEPPSFMTLVESSGGGDQRADDSEIQAVQNPHQQNSASLQAGWFPSLTHVVNDSQGRKKNEEIIAKVTNWSTGKQHAPLKSLLGEANLETKPKSPNPKENTTPVVEKDGNPTKNNGAVATTVNSTLGPEAPLVQAAKGERGQEWNSPARYPTDIKREKRKVKGKPYWVPFVCCSSVN
ncbi:hypothetical protein L1049_017301 [Liquidambar formosana]|uniref:C2H2-type domain-containing protein n=1 Tax=Liquidambar formosana TaxID=63359 RepID=A0AAP0X3M4_LIQFO